MHKSAHESVEVCKSEQKVWISGHYIGALLCTKASDIVQKREEASRKCEYASESETCTRLSKRDKARNIV